MPSALVFQNKILLKTLEHYQKIRLEVLRNGEAVLHCKKAMIDLQTKKIGNASQQYEKFIKLEDSIRCILSDAVRWVQQPPPNIKAQLLTNDFESYFLAKWIPSLKTEVPYAPPNENQKTTHYDTTFSSFLKKHLYALINMSKIGVGKDGLEYVSSKDVEKLIVWAKNFTFKQNF